MPKGQAHERKKSKNLATLLLLMAFIGIIFAVTLAKYS